MIICGTDFSAHAAAAAELAIALAARMGEPVELVHVLGEGRDSSAARAAAKARLEAEVERLAGAGVVVTTDVLVGSPDERIVELGASLGAKLIVLAALGFRNEARWLLGSVAERTAQTAATPVLVARQADALLAWARGERPLRVLVAADLSAEADVCLRWVAELGKAGPCEVTVAHLYFPPDEYRRLGLTSPGGFFEEHPEIDRILLRDLEARLGPLGGAGHARVMVRSAFGRPADDLVTMAGTEKADLVVVGSRQRRGLSRLWHGSFSHDVLRHASMAVACLPLPALVGKEPEQDRAAQAIPTLRAVLAATDLSPIGNRAVPYAYSLLAGGGVVHLISVVEQVGPEAESDREARLTRLRALVPREAAVRGIETRIEVLEGPIVGEVISQAAERLGVDALCLGSHGHKGVTKTLTGSVVREVLARTHRPVLVVRPPQA